ncbi:hypothetical protein PBRA_008344 [Plasmodiophora brassicae]|uniref:D-aminoacyl-tRNA deacylase n=1 Tax=Plasmodiophora brassicae TaxID=37360 RepID=A0A0G4J0I1_PLABS|nr:hypothetical protein PBRA_008344 [Plasmodiophora brassicae]
MRKAILGIRMWPDDNGRPWARNVVDIGGSVLLVSQFTLHATMKNGTRPSFHRAMPPSAAESLYARFVVDITEALGEDRVQGARFRYLCDKRLVRLLTPCR